MVISGKKYFLAANSCYGFISNFSDAFDSKTNWQCFIIKGGPGTGKSSFMKKLAEKGEEKGYIVEFCPCSSDPDSIDAVVFPEIKKIILDGTAPHTLDPKYPAAVETILNFGEFWDAKGIKENRENIIETTDKNKSLHRIASTYLMTAGEILKANFGMVSNSVLKDKLNIYGKGLCKKYVVGRGNGGKITHRFLTGITPKGIVSFPETVTDFYKNIIVISDKQGNVTDLLMKQIMKNAVTNRYDVIEYKNAFLPDKTDHIVIPELDLAILRETEYIIFDTPVRRIHASRFMDIRELRNKNLKFNVKTANSLIDSAIETLKIAKSVHDDLEKYYIDAMDFDGLFEFFNKFEAEFFA